MKLNINLHFLDCLDSPLFNLDIFYSINLFFLFTCIEAVWLCGTAACFLADITIYLRFPEFVCVLHSLPSCLKTEKLVKHFSALSSAFVHLPSMQRCASFGAASAGSHWCSQRWPDYAVSVSLPPPAAQSITCPGTKWSQIIPIVSVRAWKSSNF